MERLDMPGKSGLMNKGNSVINGVCRCICEPRGDNGLEGYQVGEAYRYRKMIGPDQRCFYKVYPSKEQADYCEACGPNVFKRFFEEV